MAERSVIRSNPIANLLRPRNLVLALIGILLPIVILPILLGWIGYNQARNGIYQSVTADLTAQFEGVNAKARVWQSEGYKKIQEISRNAGVVLAASDLESTSFSKTAFFNAVYRLEPKGSTFSDFVVVNPVTSAIVASTNPAWQGLTLLGTSALDPAPDWTLPFSNVQVNHAFLSPSTFAVLTAAPLQTVSPNTGLVLIGFLEKADLFSILSAPLNNAQANSILLTFRDSSYVQANPESGTFTDMKSTVSNPQIPLTTGASRYTGILNEPVIGYTQELSIFNLVGDQEPVPSLTKLLIERNQSVAFAPLSQLNTILMLIGAGILLALAIAAVQAGIFIIRPTNRIATAVNLLASGHSEEQVPVYTTREFASLATSLNRLTGSLRDVSTLVGSDGQASTRKIVISAELVQALSGAATLEDTLRTVVNLIRDRMGSDFASIYLVDEAGQFAVIREATGAAGEKLKAAVNRFPLGSYSIIGSVAQSGRAHQAPNVTEDPMYIRNDLLPDTRSEIALPIRVNKRTIGVLDIHSNTVSGFQPQDLELLQTIADQTGAAIQNVQTAETARVSTEVSQQLYRVGRLVAQASSPQEIFKAVIDGMKGTPYVVTILQSGASSMVITGFYDPVNPEASQAPVAEIAEDPETLSHLVPSTTPLMVKVESGIVRLPGNIRGYLDSLGCHAAAFLPLRQGERLLGILLLSSRDENAITPASIRPLSPIAESILSAMERLELLQTTQSRLSELATLNRMSQSISQATDMQGLFETVHEQTRNAIGDVDIVITMYDSSRDLLSFPYAYIRGETVNLDTIAMGDSLYTLVIRNAQPLLLEENVEERAAALGVRLPGIIPQAWVEKQLSSGVRLSGVVPQSWLGVPLITAGQVVGALVLLDTEHTKRFKDNDVRLLSTIATQIASTIRTSSLLQESERKAVQLQTAAEIARETIGLLDLDRLLSHSINLIRERFGFYHSSVFLLDEERKFALLRESTGEAGRQMKAREHKLGVGSQSIVGWVTENARPRVADDVTADPMHRPNPLLPATRAELGIPLRIGETVIGALDVQSTLPYAFAPDDITILQVIADQIAIAVENARLFSTTREYLARHRSLYQVTTAAASATSLDNALFSAAQGLRTTMNGARVALFLLSPDKETLIVRAHSGFNSREVESMRVPLGQGVQGWVASNKQPSLVASTAADSRYLMIDTDIQSELCVPLIHRDELLGVLDIQSEHMSAFSEDDVQLLGTVAGSLAAIMSSTVLFEQVTQERERLRHLYEEAIGMAGPPSGDMESLMRSALERVRSVSGADCVSIAFPSGEDEVRIEMCTCEPHLKHITGLVAHYGQDVIGEALSTNTTVKYSPASTGTLSRSLAQAGIKTALALPLQWTGRTIGGLLLSRMASENNFSTEEVQLANLLALQVAANLESARLFDQTRRQAEREHLLFEITSRIRRSVDMQGILTTTASELSRALGAKRASIKIGLSDATASEDGNGGGTGGPA